MKKISFRKSLTLLGARNISLHHGSGTGKTELSGFFEGTEGSYFKEPLYYCIYTPEFPVCGKKVMYRTAKDRKDFAGGVNVWLMENKLQEMGYHL